MGDVCCLCQSLREIGWTIGQLIPARIKSWKDSVEILLHPPKLEDIWSVALGDLECEMQRLGV